MTKIYNIFYMAILSMFLGMCSSGFICYYPKNSTIFQIYIGFSISLFILIIYFVVRHAVTDVLNERNDKENV